MDALRILIFEDNPHDAELIENELRKSGIDFSATRAGTRDSFLNALNRPDFDLILTDYSLSGFSGIEAVRIVKEKNPALPVILVTGTLNDETAVECMKAGAWDYVIKKNIARLTPAVKNALKMKKSIFEKKSAEEKLINSLREWQATFDAIQDGVILTDIEGKILRCNRAFGSMTGKTDDVILGRKFNEIFQADKDRFNECPFARMLDTGKSETSIAAFQDGWFRESVNPILDRSGAVSGSVVVISDITSEMLTEKKLGEEMERAQNFLDVANVMILYLDADRKVKLINRKGCEILEYSEEEIIDKDWFEFLLPSNIKNDIRGVFEDIRSEGTHEYFENVVMTKSGREKLIAWHNVRIADENGNFLGTLSSGEDITEQKKVMDELERERNLLRTLIDTLPDGVFVKDRESRFLLCNKTLADLTGVKDPAEVTGKTDYDFFSPELASSYVNDEKAVLSTGNPLLNKEEIVTDLRTGKPRFFLTSKVPLRDSSGEITGIIGVGRDIMPLKKAEEELMEKERQLHHAQKMEAVGRLAGGIAHDFNNMLTAIIGYSDYLLQKISGEEKLVSCLEGIKKAGLRAAELTSRLLAFSRRQALKPRVLNLNPAVTELAKMLKMLIGEDIEFKLSLDKDLVNIKADETKIEQVIVNLAINARDAMPEGGRLTIETMNRHLDEMYCKTHAGVTPGNYAVLVVSDTGIGMDKDMQQRVFEPFFTTKEMGKGTGLGLAIVYGVVKEMGGHIWLYSEPGKGTTFKIYFPAVEEEVKPEVYISLSAADLKGSENVLVAEDEEMVRDITVSVLKMYGYSVNSSKSGSEALDFIQRGEQPVDLLITDMVMPGMSGRELAVKAVAAKPGLKVLFISGFHDHVLINEPGEESMTFLEKPFRPVELALAVKKVLHGEDNLEKK